VKPKAIMIIAGEPSGDLLAAELVRALRPMLARADASSSPDLQPLHASLEPRFFGAGGPLMRETGVELAFDMTAHAVVGLLEVIKNYPKFRRLFHQLLRLAIEREPDAIICVDFSGFNRRFAQAVQQHVRARRGPFNNWRPKLIQYVSPQVWASREGRVRQMARDFDLLLSIFPFEQDWYAKRAPSLKVEYVGHPMLDRYARSRPPAVLQERDAGNEPPLIVLLPGSRAGELLRHLPILAEAAPMIAASQPVRFKMCLPSQALADEAGRFAWPENTEIQVGGLSEALRAATLALASTGTVTMECAWFGVPTVTFYKTSWSTYQIGKRIIQVNFLAMPNLLAGAAIYPELIQHAASAQNIARAAIELLANPAETEAIRARLAKVIQMLGEPGASQRAARAIVRLLSDVPNEKAHWTYDPEESAPDASGAHSKSFA
jgi:lipid-A-disaccharide synthase